MLRLIRRYLEAGVMAHGVVIERHEGTPQCGPLSPLLFRHLDEWIRHRLRQIHLKHWKTAKQAHAVHVVLTKEYFDGLGVPRLAT